MELLKITRRKSCKDMPTVAIWDAIRLIAMMIARTGKEHNARALKTTSCFTRNGREGLMANQAYDGQQLV